MLEDLAFADCVVTRVNFTDFDNQAVAYENAAFSTIILEFNLVSLTFDYKAYLGHPRPGDISDTHVLQVASGTCSKDDE